MCPKYEASWRPLYNCEWSPDNKHFVLCNSTPGFIGSVEGGPLVPVNGSFMAWIDATHYYYEVIGNTADTTKIYIGKIGGE